MIIMIGGTSHAGKSLLAQKLLELYKFPYLSIDHFKMGFIRSVNTVLTPQGGDTELTECLWPVIRDMIKTCIENEQNLIVEGCYIPFDFSHSFAEEYLSQIRYVCLIFSDRYISEHFDNIIENENVIEHRDDDPDLSAESLMSDNSHNLKRG
jgi:2-phosphoglycerate kinase